MQDLVFNIQKFDLVYKDVDKLIIRPIGGIYVNPEDGSMWTKLFISLQRSGYEVNDVESRNIDVPANFLEIFARYQAGIATEQDLTVINTYIGYINPQIVIIDKYVYTPPIVEEPEIPIVEEEEENNETENEEQIP